MLNLQLVREDETFSYKKLLAKSKVVITQPVQISLSGAWTRKVSHQVKFLHYLAYKRLDYFVENILQFIECFIPRKQPMRRRAFHSQNFVNNIQN